MNQTRSCSRCTFLNAGTNLFCAQCGADLKPKTMFTPGITLILIALGVVALGGIGIAVAVIFDAKSLAPPAATNTGFNAAPVTAAPPTAASLPAPAPTGTPKQSMEVMLATIDKSSSVDADDITVKRFRFLLENIQRKTKNTKDQIGDMTVNGQKLLRDKYGKEKTLLELMEDANRAIPEGSQVRWDYAEIITMLVMVEGQS